MATLDKPRLRNMLRKLRALEAGLGPAVDRGEVGQEMLDLLAIRAGLKPVCLLGRGLDDPGWIDGALALARDARLHALEGPFWEAAPFPEDAPRWYEDGTLAALARIRAWYVCRMPATVRTVARICAAGGCPTVAEEAALLGYPECCVAAHYARAQAYHRAILSILNRRAGGDPARMQALLQEEAPLEPETDAETAGFEEAMAVIPAPFGSWNLCSACASSPDSPSAALSRRYLDLAETIDPDFAGSLAVRAEPPPHWRL